MWETATVEKPTYYMCNYMFLHLFLSGWDCSRCYGLTEFRKHMLHECHFTVPQVRLCEFSVTGCVFRAP